MKKRIGAILLTLCLLAGLLPTTALAGGPVATFFIGHDFQDPKDTVCTEAGDEILLPGTHVVSVWETDFVEIDPENDGIYEVRVPFNEFIAGDPDWSISWSVNYKGDVEEGPSGKVTSITVDCPRLEEGEKSYRLYVYATLTATYEGTPYTVTGSTSLFIQDSIWKLPKGEETVHVVDRSELDSNTVPLTPPNTLMKHTLDNPAGTEAPMPDNFTVAYEVYDGDQQVTVNDAALNDPHPGCYRVYTTIKDQGRTSVVSYNQYYFVTDGNILARQNLTDTVTWTLTKDGTLTFRGDGEVPGRGTSQRAWEEFVSRYQQEYDPNYKITKVVVEEGITTLGSYVLTAGTRQTLDSVTLPSTLTKLENYVFYGYQITEAAYNGDSWASVIVGDGNENLNNHLAADGITLWVENGRLYGRFTKPKDSEPSNYDIYRLYFYDSTKTSDPDYIYAAMASPDITIDLTDMYGYGTLDHFAVYQMGDDPEQGDEPLYDVALAKPIRFQTGSFAFPAEDVTVSVEENTGTDSQYYPYSVIFSNLDETYLYELDNQDTRYSWKFEGNSVSANDKIFGACTLTALYAQSDANSYWIVSSTGYPLTISQETQPALPQQDVMVPGSFEKTYGDAAFQSIATNKSDGGGDLTYASSNTDVVTVDKNSGKVTIKGAGKSIITVTAAAVPGKYAETSASYTVTVQKANLKITADNTSIVYGQPAPSFFWTGKGWKYQDDESAVTGEAVYDCAYKTYAKVGTYPISVSGLTARNYNITFETGTLTVNKAAEYTITLDKLEQLAGHTSGVTAQISPYDDTAQITVQYRPAGQENAAWTDTVPRETGSYDVWAALSSSDNIEPQPTADTYGTLTIKQGVAVNTGSGTQDTQVAVTVTDDGTAQITANEDDIREITENANGTVSIDLGGASEIDQLVLPGNLVSELSKSGKADGLTVSTEDASASMSAPVLDTVAKAVTDPADTVSIRLESVEKEALNDAQKEALDTITTDYPVSVVEVSLVVTHSDGSEDVFHELGGDVSITVPYRQLPGVLEGRFVVACYVSDDGTVTYLFAEIGEDGRTITFTTNHSPITRSLSAETPGCR